MDSKQLVEDVVDVLREFFQLLQVKGYFVDFGFHFSFGENVDNVPLNDTKMIVKEAVVEKLQALVTDCSEVEVINDSLIPPNSNLVQIKASRDEMNRRITAFIRRKQMEVDELNVQEFCHRPRMEMVPKDSCARVDAAVVKRSGGQSHIKVSRVVNHWGPQTELSWNSYHKSEMSKTLDLHKGLEKRGKTLPSEINMDVDERLCNMETHLRLKTGQSVSKGVYERLKNLEDRILFLEGMSPDYFALSPRKLHKQRNFPTGLNKRKHVDMQGDLSLEDIDARIRRLRNNLRLKQEQKSLMKEAL